jgi:hypothetical protein
MGEDKTGDTARQEHVHNYDGPSVQEGDYIAVYCTCGALRSKTWNPGGNR